MKKPDRMRTFIASPAIKILFLMLVCLCLIFSFIVSPFTLDVKIFMSSANQTQYTESANWFIDVLRTWELKGFMNRFTMFLVYKITTLYTAFSSISFERVSKFIYILLALLLLLCSSRRWTTFLSRNHIVYLFFSLIILLFTNNKSIHMQAEMSCVLLMIFAFSLYMTTRKRYVMFIAGMIFSLVFYYKSICMIMGLTFLTGIFYLDYSQVKKKIYDIIVFLSGCFIVFLGGLFFFYLFYPQELVDMHNAAYYQETMFSATIPMNTIIKRFFLGLSSTARYYAPCLILGLGLFFYRIILLFRQRDYVRIILLVSLFIAPTAFIILSNMYFRYHYYLYMFPVSILLIELFVNNKLPEWENNNNWQTFFCLGITIVCTLVLLVNYNNKIFICCFLLLIFLFFLFIIGFAVNKVTQKNLFVCFLCIPAFCYVVFSSFISPYVYTSIKSEKRVRTMNEEVLNSLKISSSEKVLYLDMSIGAYVLGNESVSRYYFPLPIQRTKPKQDQLDCYFNAMNDCLGYQGKWLLFEEDWMTRKHKNDEIQNKINSEFLDTGFKLSMSAFPDIFVLDLSTSVIQTSIYKRVEN